MTLRLVILLSGLALISSAGAFSAGAATGVHTPAPLVGKWTKTISGATWRRHHIGYEPVGKFTITISRAGLINYYGPRVGYISNFRILAVGSGSITVSPPADGFCADKGTYTWTATAKTLALARVKDDCDPRVVLFTAGTFYRA